MMPTMITKLEHLALSVSDLERSIAFYTDVLGFELVRILEPDPSLPLARVVDMEDARARIAHLMIGGQMLELFEYVNPEGRPIPPDRNQADNGFSHVGLTSDDARADYAILREHGVKFYSDPVEFRPGVWLFYFYGPDGETLEVRQT